MNNEIKMSELFPKLRDYKIKRNVGMANDDVMLRTGDSRLRGNDGSYGRIYGCGLWLWYSNMTRLTAPSGLTGTVSMLII